MRIGKSFTFEAAHRLQNHNGKCRNLHGHSYRVEVAVEGFGLQIEGPAEGMLLDFGRLNEWWKPLEAVLDHTTILEDGDPLLLALALPEVRVTTFPWPPTAEHLAIWIYEGLLAWLRIVFDDERFDAQVRVYETAKSWAEA